MNSSQIRFLPPGVSPSTPAPRAAAVALNTNHHQLDDHIILYCLVASTCLDDRRDHWIFAMCRASHTDWWTFTREPEGPYKSIFRAGRQKNIPPEAKRYRLGSAPAHKLAGIARLASEVSPDTMSSDHPSHEYVRKIWDCLHDEGYFMEEEYYYGLDKLKTLSREPGNWLEYQRPIFD